MSTILKALRRVEAEHPAQPQRRSMRGDIIGGGGKPPPGPRRPKKSRGPNLRLWGGLGAALLLGVLVWWRLPSLTPGGEVVEALAPSGVAEPPAPPAPPAVRPPAASLADAPEPGEAPAAPAAAPPAAVPAANPELPAELAERLPPLGETLDAPEPVAAAAAVAPPAPAVEPAPPSLSVQPTRPAVRSRSFRRPSAAAAVTMEPAAEPPAPLTEPPPRVAATPPPKPASVVAKKPAVPKPPSPPFVLVERTSWHPKPERRVAWVRLEGSSSTRELHEGDALGTLVVKEIRPSGVVFLHGLEELQRRVGEH